MRQKCESQTGLLICDKESTTFIASELSRKNISSPSPTINTQILIFILSLPLFQQLQKEEWQCSTNSCAINHWRRVHVLV